MLPKLYRLTPSLFLITLALLPTYLNALSIKVVHQPTSLLSTKGDTHNHEDGLCELPHYGEDPEYTASLAVLEIQLAQTLEKYLADNFHVTTMYFHKQEKKCLSSLSKYVSEFNVDSAATSHISDIKGRAQKIIENPLLSMKMVRRILKNLVAEVMRDCKENEQIVEAVNGAFSVMHLVPPTQFELDRVLHGFLTLHFIYGWNATSQLRFGILNDRHTNIPLNFEDCLALANKALEFDVEGLTAYQWLSAANDILSCENAQEDDDYDRNRLMLDMSWKRLMILTGMETVSEVHAEMHGQRPTTWVGASFEKEYLCRGEPQLPAEHHPRDLICFYQKERDPYLYLNHLKVEVLADFPFILQFHDFLSSKEIEFIQKLAPAKAVRPKRIGGKRNFEDEKSYWESLTNLLEVTTEEMNHEEVLINLKRKVEKITKLDVDDRTASLFEMGMHSPLGGFFNLENVRDNVAAYDYNPEYRKFASFLMFLTEVEMGGYFVFPNMKASIRTTKGSALFFFNYNRRNNRETKMQHYTCPVIIGIKEVANMPLQRPASLKVDPKFH